MSGCIVKHDGCGLGQLIRQTDREAYVRFFGPPEVIVELVPGSFQRSLIIGRICEHIDMDGGKVECTILQLSERGSGWDPHTYKVEFDDGLEGLLTEDKITNVKRATEPSGPLLALSMFQYDSHRIFEAREQLNRVYNNKFNRNFVSTSLSFFITSQPN